MKPDCYLIKYAEIGIKGKNRFLFEDALMKRIRLKLKASGVKSELKKTMGRIYLHLKEPFETEGVESDLRKVFGIQAFCPVHQFPVETIEELRGNVIRAIREDYGNHPAFTFKVESRRSRKDFQPPSQEMNRILGEDILTAFPETKVDVHKPEVLFQVEVRESLINLYSKEMKGAGGMPVGTAGKGLLLLSGGIDSPVAGVRIAKRGVQIDALYFHAPPYTSDRAKEKVIRLAEEMSVYTGELHLHIVNFTDIQLAIYQNCPHEELTIIMRRLMMKIAEMVAAEIGASALVTGESVGQVASQTVQSIAVTNEAATLPVFRPLVAFDKQEIVEEAMEYGTFETSILPYEDCCTIFVAKHPVTKPRLRDIQISESRLMPLIEGELEKAVRTREIRRIPRRDEEER